MKKEVSVKVRLIIGILLGITIADIIGFLIGTLIFGKVIMPLVWIMILGIIGVLFLSVTNKNVMLRKIIVYGFISFLIMFILIFMIFVSMKTFFQI